MIKPQQFSLLAYTVPLAVALLGSLLVAQADAATSNAPNAAIEARYKAERAACLNGSSPQDRATCLKEAGAAREQAAKGELVQGSPDYAANALARCEKVPAADRADCKLMARGYGTKSGSVAQGAVVRELVTQTVAPAASAASAP